METGLDALVELLRGRRVAALTGAGCSTESGIPDYRSPAQLNRVRRPIQHQEFVQRPEIRARYWARSMLGWPRFSRFEPNGTHTALAALERSGVVNGVITQNVDRLHHKAGNRRVVELHGALARVKCLACNRQLPRDEFQERLLQLNPGFTEQFLPELRPDGDAELPGWAEHAFRVPPCDGCDGVLMPDVVFFGGHVAPPVVAAAYEIVDEAEALLIVGSSLAVYSGYRFAKRAAERGIPIAIVNRGETRADPLAALRIDALSSEALARLASALA